MPWTRLDILLTALALLLAALMLAHTGYEFIRADRAADQVWENIQGVSSAVERYRQKTGMWFPPTESGKFAGRVFPDPFHPDGAKYQGLDEKLLWFENNFGIISQLTRFDPAVDRTIPANLFEKPFLPGEPYLRVLVDYGKQNQVEESILLRVQTRLPEGALAELDDHYYVIDLRRLINAD